MYARARAPHPPAQARGGALSSAVRVLNQVELLMPTNSFAASPTQSGGRLLVPDWGSCPVSVASGLPREFRGGLRPVAIC